MSLKVHNIGTHEAASCPQITSTVHGFTKAYCVQTSVMDLVTDSPEEKNKTKECRPQFEKIFSVDFGRCYEMEDCSFFLFYSLLHLRHKDVFEQICFVLFCFVPSGSPSRCRDVTVYIPDINQPSLPPPFYSALVSASVLMAYSTVFHSINSSDNSPLSHSVLISAVLVLSTIYLFMTVSLSPDVLPCG